MTKFLTNPSLILVKSLVYYLSLLPCSPFISFHHHKIFRLILHHFNYLKEENDSSFDFAQIASLWKFFRVLIRINQSCSRLGLLFAFSGNFSLNLYSHKYVLLLLKNMCFSFYFQLWTQVIDGFWF